MNRSEGSNYYLLNRREQAAEQAGNPAAAMTPEQEYDQLKRKYPQAGILKAQTYAGERGFPIPDVRVEVSKTFSSGRYLIDAQYTDISGLTRPILLPAHPAAESSRPGVAHPFTTYDILFMHPKYTTILVHNVAIFEGVASMQAMEMIPSGAAADGRTILEYYVHATDLLGGQGGR